MYKVKIGSLYLVSEDTSGDQMVWNIGVTDQVGVATEFTKEQAQHNASVYGGTIEKA